MLKGILSRLLRTKRLSFAVLGNGMISLASLALSVSIARSSSIEGFASFSIAMVAYLFGSGLIRSALTDTALSRPSDPATFARSFQRASLVSLVAALVLVCWGLISGNGYLVVLGVAFHGILLFDFIRTFDSAAGGAGRALLTSVLWSSITLVSSVVAFVGALDPATVFAFWAGSGAVCGYILLAVTDAPLLPRWTRNAVDTRVASLFSLDYLVGSGGALLTTGLLGVVDNGRVLSSIRGAGTLLGPLNLISTTARSLMLPYLSRRIDAPRGQLRAAAQIALIQVLVLAPLLVGLQFLPAEWGRELLGDTWDVAKLALLPLSIEALLGLVSAVANSGHRVAFAGGRSLALRLAVGVPRPFVVLACAHLWGIEGAAWSMAIMAAVNTAIWWISYYNITRPASS